MVKGALLLITLIIIGICCPAAAFAENKNQLILYGSNDFPPYSYIDNNGNQAGMATELSYEIAKIQRININLQLKEWTEVHTSLKNNRADVIQDISLTRDMDVSHDFSLPYYKTSQVVFYRKSDPAVQPDALSNKKVIVVKDDISHDYILASDTHTRLTMAKNNHEAMTLLESGGYDCLLMEKLSGLYLINELKYHDIIYSEKPLLNIQLCYAAEQGKEKNIELINDGLATLKSSGRYQQIEEKWLGSLIEGVNEQADSKTDKTALTPEEKKWLQEHNNTITLAPMPYWPPMDFFDEYGNYNCFTSEYLNIIQKKLGIKFKIIRTKSHQDRLDRLKNNEIEATSSLQKTFDREAYLNFTSPYLHIPCVFITRKDSTFDFNNYEQIAGLKVAMVRGYAVKTYLEKNYPGIQLIPMENDIEVLQSIAMGEVDAGVSDLAISPHLISKLNISNLKMAAEVGFVYDLRMASQKELPILNSILEKGIGMVSEKEKEQLIDKWLGIKNTQTDWRNIIKYISAVLVPLLLILFVILLWNHSLQRMVKIKTNELEAKQKVIIELNSSLEEKVAERTRELSLYTKELEAFSYSVSHDLRAPLRSIDGFSQALFEDANELLNDECKDYIRRIRAASQKMGELIDDMLRLSRITRSEIKTETVDITSMAEEIMEERIQADPQRKTKIVIQPGMHATGDRGMIRIVLENLLDNAWKYTQKKDITEIEFYSEQKDDKQMFFIRDNGAGFDMQYAEKMFAPFQRLHDQRDFQGIGIGLAIVQRIILRHGGEISAVGKPGESAVFSFTLPEKNSG